MSSCPGPHLRSDNPLFGPSGLDTRSAAVTLLTGPRRWRTPSCSGSATRSVASTLLGGHPKPAINGHLQNRQLTDAGRDVDEGEGRVVLRRDEQRLGPPRTAADSCARPTGLDAAPDRRGDGCPPRDRQRGTCGRRGFRCAAAVDRAKVHQNRQLRRRCPPTSPQNRQFRRRRCPPTRAGRRRAPSASACEPYRELITEALDRGRNAVAI